MARVKELNASLEGKLSRVDLAEFENENFGSNYKFGLFRQLTVYVDKYLNVGNASSAIEFHPLDLVETTLAFYGARIVQSPGDLELTHVVIWKADLTRLEELKCIRYIYLHLLTKIECCHHFIRLYCIWFVTCYYFIGRARLIITQCMICMFYYRHFHCR
jgi:hypothetical protein